MAYADYGFYTGVYLGDLISETDFPRLAERASEYLSGATDGASDALAGKGETQLQKATCAIAEVLQDEARMAAASFSADQRVSSETVGSHSVSYGSGGLSSAQLEYLEARKQEILLLYLGRLFRVKSYPCTHRRW